MLKILNKEILLKKLYKKYPNLDFEIIVDKLGYNYILLWKQNKNDVISDMEIKSTSLEIHNKIQNLKKELETENDNIPFIFVGHYDKYKECNYKKIHFPYGKMQSSVDIIVKELIEMIISLSGIKTVLKGSASAFLCYDIGNRISNNINFSSTYESIYTNMESIINYCTVNGLHYKTNFKKKRYFSKKKTDKISIYINIENMIKITFDNSIQLYGYKEVVVINNIPTYTLETLIKLRTIKMQNNELFFKSKNLIYKGKTKDLETIKKYQEKLNEIKNKEVV